MTTYVCIHGIITHGVDAPNIIPDNTSACFFIRAETWNHCEEVPGKIRNIAEGAALATGCTVKIERFQNEVHNFILNPVLDSIVGEELEALGEVIHIKKEKGLGSTDTGNVSHVVPIAHPHIKTGPDDLLGHTNEFCEVACSVQGDTALIVGAKALALTGYRLLTDRELPQKVKDDFEKSKAADSLINYDLIG